MTLQTVPKFISANCSIAIDPGNKESGWVVFRPWLPGRGEQRRGPFEILGAGKTENVRLRNGIRTGLLHSTDEQRTVHWLLIEMLRARGMPTANEEFETCVQIGLFRSLWKTGPWSYAFRSDIKLCVCGDPRAKDSNIRASLIEIWGGQNKAIGGKKCGKCKGKGWFGAGRPKCGACSGREWAIPPGPLYGVTSDAWAALAIAYWWMTEGEVHHDIPPPKAKGNKRKRGSRKSTLVGGGSHGKEKGR